MCIPGWSKFKRHLAALRLWAAPHLEIAENYAYATAPSVARLLVLLFIFGCSVRFSLWLKDETRTLMFPVWWCAALLGYTLTALLAVPEDWWRIAKEWQGRIGYLLALAVAAISWLSAGFASSEINAMFQIPAAMLPFSLTAYSFAIAVFFISATGTFLIVLPLTFFYIFSAISSFSISQKGKGAIRQFAAFATTFLVGQLWFLIAFQPVSSGYVGPVIARLALEFDFDDKTLCQNLPDKRKYLFLTSNREVVLQVQPTPDWVMTPGEMAAMKKRGDALHWIENQIVAKCEF